MDGKHLLERALRDPDSIDNLSDDELARFLAAAGVDPEALSRRVKTLLDDAD